MTNKGGRGKSIIKEMGLEDTVTKELLDGLGYTRIANRHGISREVVRAFAKKVKTRPPAISSESNPSSQYELPTPSNIPIITHAPSPISPAIERSRQLVQLTREVAQLQLSKLLDQCEANYNRAIQEGNEVLAGSWAREWSTAIDRLLRATGTYSRAAREAQLATSTDSKPIEIIITHVSAAGGYQAQGIA